jgi:hypothetical protein
MRIVNAKDYSYSIGALPGTMAIREHNACYTFARSMRAMPKSALGFLLRRAGLGIFGVAGLSFGIGGAISEFGQTDRFLSEFEGIGLGSFAVASAS